MRAATRAGLNRCPAGGWLQLARPGSARALLPVCLALLACLAVTGCATHADHLVRIRQDFYSGKLDAAAQLIDERLEKGDREADVLLLERAMVQLFSGKPAEAEASLRQVRDRFDYLEQQSLGEQAVSMLTDDNRRAYAGEDYEKLLVRAMLALTNLADDAEDAAAYGWQITQKQQELLVRSDPFAPDVSPDVSADVSPGVSAHGAAGSDATTAAPPYQRVALGAYLQAMLRESTHVEYEDAVRARARVVSWQPGFGSGAEDLERARHGRHSQRGHGVVYIFALVGRGPYKVEAAELPSSAALAIADRLLTATTSYRLPPTVAPVKVPLVVRSANRIRDLELTRDGRALARTETITDVGLLAQQQYEAAYPSIVARAVVRRVVKKGVLAAGQQQLDGGNQDLSRVALDVAGIVWEATESADTRCWGLLPDKIQVARLELPTGNHELGLTPRGESGPLGPPSTITVPIHNGRDTYVLACFPDSQPVGRILIGPTLPGSSVAP